MVSTAGALDPDTLITPLRPRPMSTLLAAARRITTAKAARVHPMTGREWQDEAWNMYDLVGENRFLASTLAGRMSQARLYVGKLPEDDTQEPEQVTSGPAADAFDALSTAPGRQQMIARLGTGLFIAGEGWIVGIPKQLLDPDATSSRVSTPNAPVHRIPPSAPASPEPSLEDLEWRVLSVAEVSAAQGDKLTLRFGEGKEGVVTVDPDQVYLIRVWRPHPRMWHEADSPVRASLPVLRELTGLTMHVGAQVDSRLAGAGLLLVPSSASAAVRQSAGADPGDDTDPLTEALMEAMITPIRDRSSASALVPLTLTVPDESIAAFRHLTFSSTLDPEARNLREEAIRRLALGLDAPPELLLGTADQNHWGAWLVREDVVSTHLEPPLALICDALTTQYLRPVLTGQGLTDAEAASYVIWYDVSGLVTRPNRFADATALHTAGVLSDAAYRKAGGFGDEDAPPTIGAPSADRALQLVTTRGGAALAVSPGIIDLSRQLAKLSLLSEAELAAEPLDPLGKGAPPAGSATPSPAGTQPEPPKPESAPLNPAPPANPPSGGPAPIDEGVPPS